MGEEQQKSNLDAEEQRFYDEYLEEIEIHGLK